MNEIKKVHIFLGFTYTGSKARR